MADAFTYSKPGLSSPPDHVFAITPADDTDLDEATRAINVATAGTVRVTTTEGNVGTLYVAAGIPFPIRARIVHATGTTATGIVGLY